MSDRAETEVTAIFREADVRVDGDRPWDFRVRDRRVFQRLLAERSLGFGESYMDGWWDCERLDEMMERLFRAGIGARRVNWRLVLQLLVAGLFNLQTRGRAAQVVDAHYDLGNELFERMLDRNMVYTCAYWAGGAQDLEAAQIAKMDLVCRKLEFARGMRVLDIGCGFGAFMKYAAETYGVSCVGYSLSRQQSEIARQRCAGLPVELVLDDYRNIRGTFDRVVSIGMFEAVGVKNFRRFFEVVQGALARDGLALVHTIGGNASQRMGDPWMDRYIFPNGMFPSIAQIGHALEGLFVMEDWHNFGPSYPLTLREWNRRFQAAWPDLARVHPPHFKRMWEFYLLACAGGFAARSWQLWQLVLSHPGRAQPASCRAHG